MNTILDDQTAVNLDVGGYLFTLFFDDLAKHRDTFFDTILKKEWRQETDKTVRIERDGRLFRYVLAYLVNGCLPRDDLGVIALSSEEILAIREEADFFNLPGLVDECNSLTKTENNYLKMINHHGLIDSIYIRNHQGTHIDYCKDGKRPSPLLKALQNIPRTTSRSVYEHQDQRSFCVTGKFYNSNISKYSLLKSSTIRYMNVPELLAEATQSPFGKGALTVVDSAVRDSVELPASSLNADTLASLVRELTPKIHWKEQMAGLELRPYKLVLYQEGGHFDAHRDTVRGDGHIGTLVLVLNSAYTGGELEVAHAGKTVSVTGAHRWGAMYGDCLHQIKPVTSGTRVSLIFDIYATPAAVLHPTAQVDCPAEKKELVEQLSEQLEEYEAVTICLEHMYPKHQAVPGYLKGHDATLYALLQEEFDVEIVSAVVNRWRDYDDEEDRVEVKFIDGLEFHTQQHKCDAMHMKFAIPGQSDNHHHVLIDVPYIEYTGNESQQPQYMYMTTGLLVRRKNTA